MHKPGLASLQAEIANITAIRTVGRVSAVRETMLSISGLSGEARLGDRVHIEKRTGGTICGEILQLEENNIVVLPEEDPQGVSLGDRASLSTANSLSPDDSWIGRIVDPYGQPMDGRPLLRGTETRNIRAAPPSPARRRGFGVRLNTGMAAFNTLLPIANGQRLGLFAGSGVGKSSLIGSLCRHMEADVVVIALIGERGRELRDFVEKTLGPDGMARAVIVAATSDTSPLLRRRCAWTAMSVAEYFRDQGKEVLFLADSITRFAEAHREVASAAGELPTLRGYPASTAHMIMSLCERAGPGEATQANITALFSVLVAGSDMDEPIADILRGVLDGHIVLDREIAERGRFPAIDLLRSVSRSLPDAATDSENEIILLTRKLIGAYARSETMIKAGLYSGGTDEVLDQAIKVWNDLDHFIGERGGISTEQDFSRLSLILRRAGVKLKTKSAPLEDMTPAKLSP